MGKGKRKAERKARTAARPNQSQRRAERNARLALVLSPDTAPEVAAKQLLDLDLHPIEAADLLLKGDPRRARDVADAALDHDPTNPDIQQLAIEVAVYTDDLPRAEHLLRTAANPNPYRHAAVCIDLERPADAVDLLDPICRTDPANHLAQRIRAEALVMLSEHDELDRTEPCPCGSGKAFGVCCHPRDLATINLHTDTAERDALDGALNEYWSRDGFAAQRDDAATDWVDPTRRPDIVMDRAMRAGALHNDDDNDCMLGWFAADPDTQPELARRARDRHVHGLYGLWQIAEPYEPSVELVDIVSGTTVYAVLDEDLLEQVVRWTVLLGGLYPVDGIWQVGAVELLSPWEAEALVPEVYDMLNVVAEETLRRRGKRYEPIEYDPGLPASVTARAFDPPEEPDSLTSSVVAVGLPRLLDLVHEMRAQLPVLQNTDGDPLVQLTAQVRVAAAATLLKRLAAREDFEVDGGEAEWLRFGEQGVDTAAARAMAEDMGIELTGEPRTLLARIQVMGDIAMVEVNSRCRMERLLAILTEVGAEPIVEDETRFDPILDLPAQRGGPSGFVGADPPQAVHDAWVHVWLDEEVPALGGLTPREASKSPEGSILLEALLREFEFRGDMARNEGRSAPDVELLRELLSDQF